MAIKQVDQLLYDELFRLSAETLQYDTYLSLPDLNVSYPFVVIGESQLLPQPTKTRLIGEIAITVHVWSNSGNRFEVSEMLKNMFNAGASIRQIGNVQYSFNLNSPSRIIYDNSTNEVLVHGVLELSFNFY